MAEQKPQDQNFILRCLYIKEGKAEEALKCLNQSFEQYKEKNTREIISLNSNSFRLIKKNGSYLGNKNPLYTE